MSSFKEFLAENKPLSNASLQNLIASAASLPPIVLAKLIKDLEDIKRGGDEWRKNPSNLGVKSAVMDIDNS